MLTRRRTHRKGRVRVSITRIPRSLHSGIRKIVPHVMLAERPAQQWDISVAQIEARAIRELNIRYRRKYHTPDVLSFLLQEPEDALSGAAEILVCLPQVKRGAKESGIVWQNHFFFLLIHSCLHILGFHHDTMPARKRMEAREKKYVGANIS